LVFTQQGWAKRNIFEIKGWK